MHDSSLASILKDVISSTTSLIRSEIHLAKVELKISVKDAQKRAITLGLCGVMGVMGLTSLLAFLVIGLGDLFGGRYWLSSLIVAAAFLAPSAMMALRAVKGFEQDVAFPEIKESFARDRQVLEQSVSRIKTDIALATAVLPHEAGNDELRVMNPAASIRPTVSSITPPEFKSEPKKRAS
ncbi:MAG: phage holin family protein [Methylotenera sp.]|nr:phage holin family protein [Oligoflexia bacterium]